MSVPPPADEATTLVDEQELKAMLDDEASVRELMEKAAAEIEKAREATIRRAQLPASYNDVRVSDLSERVIRRCCLCFA